MVGGAMWLERCEVRIAWTASTAEQVMVDQVNAARANPEAACAAVGVTLNQDLPAGWIVPGPKPQLAWDERLGNAARKYAAKLMERGVITHELDGTLPVGRVAAEGYRAAVVLENAGITFCTLIYVDPMPVELMMRKHHELYVAHAGHRAQEFDPRTSNIGVGLATGQWGGGSPGYLTVVLFGSTPSCPPPRLFYRLGGREPATLLE